MVTTAIPRQVFQSTFAIDACCGSDESATQLTRRIARSPVHHPVKDAQKTSNAHFGRTEDRRNSGNEQCDEKPSQSGNDGPDDPGPAILKDVLSAKDLERTRAEDWQTKPDDK